MQVFGHRAKSLRYFLKKEGIIMQTTAKKNPLTNNRYGKMGWILIVYYFLVLMLNCLITADGAQIIIPALAGESGMDSALMLNWNTWAGYLALIAYIPIGAWAQKKGARFQTFVLCLLTGIAFLFLGYTGNMVTYALCLCVANIGINGSGWISCAKLTSNWFPRKKGMVMGWTTIGNNFATVACVPLLSVLIAAGGTKLATTVFGALCIAVAIFGLIFLKETPEECGLYPDNITPEQEKQYGIEPVAKMAAAGQKAGRFTVGQILRMKEFWIISLTMAFGMAGGMAAVAFSTVRMQEFGLSSAASVTINSILALLACVGSYVWGWIDQKFGTQKAMIAFYIVEVIAVAMNVCAALFLNHNLVLLFISQFLFFWCLGGAANWPVSLSATLFDRDDFMKVQTPYTVIFTAGRCTGFSLLALGMSMTHGLLDGAYIISGVCNLIALLILLALNVPKFKAKYYA